MPPKTNPSPNAEKFNETERIKKILSILKETYPNAKPALFFRNPLELLIATILSARCTDEQVNLVTAKLFQKYHTAADYAAAPIEELENAIHSLGFYKTKAKNIKNACQILASQYNGEVPPQMEKLVNLPGVGRKTANVVLGNAFGINEGIVVDTHVSRVSFRLGLTKEKQPEKIEKDLMRCIPKESWTEFSNLIIWHGRKRCKARNPDCPHCELNELCPKIGVKN
ncbi:endonuclease III [Methylacidiphilum kamchatkense Kam1]|uniref:Endonuclease III n=1 Tax=Methylacidiphilum kamchatkense Kam1 TaxID=1202785 RepID=A0A0C1RUW9_9BACT|nr:endonuclease III [Methylacidiphilum kamchatkense]KIE58761.1 endonuclease III [Methylacidiphilum kamchatkense Kam1]QDQ41839.1 DNA-(apurinic or apyrimidinic site) lyase /endonuclease III [Methylacidiphilum kamchatkense Kam1]